MKDYSSYVGIVGGGIAGLTAGCALRLQGIKTVVFERSEKTSEYGAGISISPNGFGLLEKLGIKDSLMNESFSPSRVVMSHLNKEIIVYGNGSDYGEQTKPHQGYPSALLGARRRSLLQPRVFELGSRRLVK